MTSLKSFRKQCQQLHMHDMRGLAAFCFSSSGRKSSQQIMFFLSIFKVQTVFTPISRPDKHAELLKIYFKPLIKKLKFSALVPKSNLRFKIH